MRCAAAALGTNSNPSLTASSNRSTSALHCGIAAPAPATHQHRRRRRCCAATPMRGAHVVAAAASTANPAAAANLEPSAAPAAAGALYPPPPLPATYRLCVADAIAPSFAAAARVAEAPLPRPGPGEVLVHIHWAGVNGGCETFRVRGEHAFAANRGRRGFPLGAEGSGVVAAVGGGVRGLQVGQPVAFNGGAAFAEYTIAKAASCTPVAAPTAAAAALTLSALTACAALEGTAGIRDAKGESGGESGSGRPKTVLVTAAAGGTGHFAVQLARLAGCRVVAVTGSPAKVAKLKELRPDAVVCAPPSMSAEELDAALAAAAPDGVDVAYEGVGGPLRGAVLRRLAPGGLVLQVGYISEYPHVPAAAAAAGSGDSGDAGDAGSGSGGNSAAGGGRVPLEELFWRGGVDELEGGRRCLGKVWPSDPKVLARCKRRVFDLHAAGDLVAWTDEGHGLRGVEGVAGAVEYMLRGGHVGKVVISMLP